MKAILSLPPTLNSMYRTVNGRVYKSNEAKKWEENEGWIIKANFKLKPYTKPVYVGIVIGITRERDIDSVIKITLDLLQKQQVVIDDKQIMHLTVLKQYVKENPGMTIEVEELA